MSQRKLHVSAVIPTHDLQMIPAIFSQATPLQRTQLNIRTLHHQGARVREREAVTDRNAIDKEVV